MHLERRIDCAERTTASAAALASAAAAASAAVLASAAADMQTWLRWCTLSACALAACVPWLVPHTYSAPWPAELDALFAKAETCTVVRSSLLWQAAAVAPLASHAAQGGSFEGQTHQCIFSNASSAESREAWRNPLGLLWTLVSVPLGLSSASWRPLAEYWAELGATAGVPGFQQNGGGGDSGGGSSEEQPAIWSLRTRALKQRLVWSFNGKLVGFEKFLCPAVGGMHGRLLLVHTGWTGAHMHVDEADNVLTQLSGSKQVWFFDSNETARISTLPYALRHNPARLVAALDPPPVLHSVVLTPGDSLVIPRHTFHHPAALTHDSLSAALFTLDARCTVGGLKKLARSALALLYDHLGIIPVRFNEGCTAII